MALEFGAKDVRQPVCSNTAMQGADDVIHKTIVLVGRTTRQRIPFVQDLSNSNRLAASHALALLLFCSSHSLPSPRSLTTALGRRRVHPLVGPPGGRWYTAPMTQALDTAIAKLATLPADEQDRVARWLLDELRDEEHWDRQWGNSQDVLSALAAEARADHAAGRTTELDPEKL